MSNRSTSFIVTGGAGFIGSNLVEALNARGHTDVLIVDHLNHPLKNDNLLRLRYREFVDKTLFRQRLCAGDIAPVTTVFHLGACSSTTQMDDSYLTDNNVHYTRELCEWSLANEVRFIYASSAATYGDGGLGYSDDPALIRRLVPLNPYGRSKQAFDRWALDHGILDRVVGLKYFNVYGPHEAHKGDMRSVIHKAYQQICDRGDITLFKSHRPDYRHGEQLRDFVYVRDAVNTTLFFHDQPATNGLYNCGTGIARSWLDLAHALFAAMQKPPVIRFVEMPELIRDKYQYYTRADVGRLRSAGYTHPFASIEEGVSDYVRMLLDNAPTR
jgi:ADP-L-glycero-D-manno-heptose 6-epimerase